MKKTKRIVVVDSSGSMHEKIMNGNMRSSLKRWLKKRSFRLIICDSDVQGSFYNQRIKTIGKVKFKRYQGTILQPALDLVANWYSKPKKFNWEIYVYTDGYIDKLDFTHLNVKNIVVISTYALPNGMKTREDQNLVVEVENENGTTKKFDNESYKSFR